MSHPIQLTDLAQEIATNASGRAAALQHELLQIETRKGEVEAQLHAANLAYERLSSFVPVRGGNLQCPRCWIDRETVASLRPVGGGTRGLDIFECTNCYAQLTLHV